VLNWLGLSAPGFITSDSGYAYALSGFGIVGIALFWIALMLLKGADHPFYLARDLSGAYFAILLCISNSPFTIKTGALLWFLVGVVSQNRRVIIDAVIEPMPADRKPKRLRYPRIRHAGKEI
jgi:putative polymerase